MIRTFRDRRTKAIFEGRAVKNMDAALQRRARRKLLMIDAAVDLVDLRTPPGNRLEKLSGDRVGRFSVRGSGQWRICFSWWEGRADDVELVDYH